MNTLKKIGSIVLAAILMTGAASFSANAQFKGFGNKLKGKVERTVKEKVEKKKHEAKEAVKTSTELTLNPTPAQFQGLQNLRLAASITKRPTHPETRQKRPIRSPLQLKCGKDSTKVSDNFTERMRIWRISP